MRLLITMAEYAYHVGRLDTANIEPLRADKYRTTGKLGTGLYVYNSAAEIEWQSDTIDVVYPIRNPWRTPFVIDRTTPKEQSAADFHRFYETCEGLNAILTGADTQFGAATLEARVKAIVKHSASLWKKQLPIYDPKQLTRDAIRALRVAKASYDADPHKGGIQPMTLLLQSYGFDGIQNLVFDTNAHGSIIFDVACAAIRDAQPWVLSKKEAKRDAPLRNDAKLYVDAMIDATSAFDHVDIAELDDPRPDAKRVRVRHGGRRLNGKPRSK
jgi:hypothetical protein